MKPLHTDHWQYYFAKPVSTGIFKFQADDFQVVEDLGYTLVVKASTSLYLLKKPTPIPRLSLNS